MAIHIAFITTPGVGPTIRGIIPTTIGALPHGHGVIPHGHGLGDGHHPLGRGDGGIPVITPDTTPAIIPVIGVEADLITRQHPADIVRVQPATTTPTVIATDMRHPIHQLVQATDRLPKPTATESRQAIVAIIADGHQAATLISAHHPVALLAPLEITILEAIAAPLVRQETPAVLQAEATSEHLNQHEAIHIAEVAQTVQVATAPAAIVQAVHPAVIPVEVAQAVIPEVDVQAAEVIEAVKHQRL